MTKTVTIAPVRKSIRVNSSQSHAFEVFTAGIGRWWPGKATIGDAPMRTVVIETHVGGRWYEESEEGAQTTVGTILLWDPPRRFVVSWTSTATGNPTTL
jgi:hypothetical protein